MGANLTNGSGPCYGSVVAVRQLDVAAVLELSSGRRRQSPRGTKLQLASDHVTLREVIGSAVEVEMRRAEVRAQVALGELLFALLGGSAGSTGASLPMPDVKAETERALTGFREGSYRVIFDGQPVTDLDEKLSVGLRSRVTFMRIVPLVSG